MRVAVLGSVLLFAFLIVFGWVASGGSVYRVADSRPLGALFVGLVCAVVGFFVWLGKDLARDARARAAPKRRDSARDE